MAPVHTSNVLFEANFTVGMIEGRSSSRTELEGRNPPGGPTFESHPQTRSQRVVMARRINRQQFVERGTQVESPVQYKADLFELWVNGALVKRLDIRAVNQAAILTA